MGPRGLVQWDIRKLVYHRGWYWLSQTRYASYGPNITMFRRSPNAYVKQWR